MNILFVALVVTSLTFCGCSGSALAKRDHLFKNLSMAQPKEGKALVNFHRPSPYGFGAGYRIFNSEGQQITILYGYQGFQYQCEPGEQVFYGWSKWASKVSVVKATLAPNRVYDILVDYGVNGNFSLIPLAKSDSRRNRLPIIEAEEEHTKPLTDERVVEISNKMTEKGWGFFGLSQGRIVWSLQDSKGYTLVVIAGDIIKVLKGNNRTTTLSKGDTIKVIKKTGVYRVVRTLGGNKAFEVLENGGVIKVLEDGVQIIKLQNERSYLLPEQIETLSNAQGFDNTLFMTDAQETREFKMRLDQRKRDFIGGAIAGEVKTIRSDDCR